MLVTERNFAEACEHLDHQPEIFTDSETTGLDCWTGDKPVGISMKGPGLDTPAFYFPFMHVTGNLGLEHWHKYKPLLSKPEVKYVGFNYGFDLKMFHVIGAPLPKKVECVQLAAHLMNENEMFMNGGGKNGPALKKLGVKYINKDAAQEMDKLDQLLIARGLGKGDMGKLHPSEVEEYACKDVILTEQLRDFYRPHLEKWKLYDLWQEVNQYLLEITKMEVRGMQLNVELIERQIIEATINEAKAKTILEGLAGYPINPNSSPQVCAWLRVASSAADALEPLRDKVPGVRELQAYRAWSSVQSRYYVPFLNFMDKNEVLHPNLNLTGTITGRLSCARPNLQAVAVRDEIWKVKDVVIARPGFKIVEWDWSQAELRVACHYGEERTMGEKLARGADIHTETAETLNIPRDTAAKPLNFSVVYGVGAATLAERLRIGKQLAQQYLNKYHALYPGFRRLYNRCEATASDRGYIRMYTGRLRHYNCKEAYTHKASSNLVQGAVGEMARLAILKAKKACGEDLQLFMQVHDSLLGEVPEALISQVVPVVRDIMNDQPWCTVPMRVDVKTGLDWGHMEKYKQ